MKLNVATIRQISALMLTSIYLIFWAVLSLHHFIAPEHQHEQKVCSHDPDEKHLHSEEYAAVECSICQLAPSLAELPELPDVQFTIPVFASPQISFGKTFYRSAAAYSLSKPRAPPVRIA